MRRRCTSLFRRQKLKQYIPLNASSRISMRGGAGPLVTFTRSTRSTPATATRKLLAMIPFVLFSWYLIFHPLLGYLSTPDSDAKIAVGATTADWQNRAFLLALLAATLLLALINRSRLSMHRLWSPPIVSLAAYLVLCGASVAWAYAPGIAFNRFCLEMMILIPLILPFALVSPTRDTVRSVYWYYILAIIINIIVISTQKPVLTATGSIFGYFGYFTFKGYLGQCASIAIILSFYELLFSGRRRIIAILVILASVWVIFASESKGSLAFTLVAPSLAGLTLIISTRLRIPVLAVLAAIPVSYAVVSMVASSNLTGRISYMFYGDSSLTGRTVIWDFVYGQMAVRPWLGWGFHSFWLVGPDAPSVALAPYWVKVMTGSHSGYLDVRLETGYIGYALFLIFIMASLYAMEPVRRQDPARAWLLLSLALYVIITNLIETVWMATNDPLWLLFVLVVAETTRYSGSAKQTSLAANRHRQPQKSRPLRNGYVPQGLRTNR